MKKIQLKGAEALSQNELKAIVGGNILSRTCDCVLRGLIPNTQPPSGYHQGVIDLSGSDIDLLSGADSENSCGTVCDSLCRSYTGSNSGPICTTYTIYYDASGRY